MASQMRIKSRHAKLVGGLWTAGVVLLLAMTLSGCVPIPYKPSASVSHQPVTAEESSAITLSAKRNFGMLESLSKSIQHAEPRVTLVDGSEYLGSLSAGRGTLAEVLAGRDTSPLSTAASGADYLLCVGSPVHRQLHDTGAAAPFIFFPAFWVGYEKTQSRESLVASLIDLHAPTPADGLQVSSTYSEVIASLVYGVGTIAMPQSALRDALAKDVAHTIAAAHPSGPIRLIVLGQKGGTAEPDPKDMRKPPGPVVAKADEAAR
jgi:hypothetical protein